MEEKPKEDLYDVFEHTTEKDDGGEKIKKGTRFFTGHKEKPTEVEGEKIVAVGLSFEDSQMITNRFHIFECLQAFKDGDKVRVQGNKYIARQFEEPCQFERLFKPNLKLIEACWELGIIEKI